MSKRAVPIHFEPDTITELDELADQHETSRAELVRKAVSQYLQRDGFA